MNMARFQQAPMVYIQMKQSPSEPDFALYLKTIIARYYQEDPESFNLEIKELEDLRRDALKAPSDEHGCLMLKRYYAQLLSLSNRFRPLGVSGVEPKFVWIDKFTKEKVTGGFDLEMQSVLHNLGAMYSEIASRFVRDTSDNKKQACSHFQCAAWPYDKIREQKMNLSKDLDSETNSFNYYSMLGQAQECVVEKAVQDERNAAIIAKVASQVVEYHSSAHAILIQSSLSQQSDSLYELLGSKKFKEWKEFNEFKMTYYSAVTCAYMGKDTENSIGARIAWYQLALEKMKKATKTYNFWTHQDLYTLSSSLTEMVEKNLQQAQKENDLIYNFPVLKPDQLPAVKGVSLVKCTPVDLNDPKIGGKDIFHKLVPIEVYEQMSIYSDRKDQLWREIKQSIDLKDEKLMQFMSTLKLDKNQIGMLKMTIPEQLIEACASLSLQTDSIEETKAKFNNSDEMRKEIEPQMKNCRQMIQNLNEAMKDKKPTELVDLNRMIKELDRCEENYKAGVQLDRMLRDKFYKSLDNVHLMSKSSVKDLEQMFEVDMSQVPQDADNLKEVKRLLDKVEEMRTQRQTQANELDKSLKSDDILNKILMQPKEKLEELFESELSKHDKYVGYLKQNLQAQDNILDALIEENGKYSKTKTALEMHKQKVEKQIDGFLKSRSDFEYVTNKIDEGVAFFENVTKLIKDLKIKMDEFDKKLKQENRAKAVKDASIDAQSKQANQPNKPFYAAASAVPNGLNYTINNPSIGSKPTMNVPYAGIRTGYPLPVNNMPNLPNMPNMPNMPNANPPAGMLPNMYNKFAGNGGQINAPMNPNVSGYSHTNVQQPHPHSTGAPFPVYPMGTNNAMYSSYPQFPVKPNSNYPNPSTAPAPIQYSNVPNVNVSNTYASTAIPQIYSPYPGAAGAAHAAHAAAAAHAHPALSQPANYLLEQQMQNMQIGGNLNSSPASHHYNYGSNYTGYVANPTGALPHAVPQTSAVNIMNIDNDLSVDKQPVLQPTFLNPMASAPSSSDQHPPSTSSSLL